MYIIAKNTARGKIYKITNIKTNKVYIGQTTSKYLSTRWNRHLAEVKKGSVRKLYASIRKHGKESFLLEIIEEVENNKLEEREIYWIAFYNSYKQGYNSNLGGCKQESKVSGKEEEIIDLYNTKSIQDISNLLNISRTTIRNFLKSLNIYTKKPSDNKGHKNNCVSPRQVQQFTKDNIFIKEFDSMIQAIKELNLNKKASSHISKCCQGKKPSAYGYVWKYKY